MTLVVVGGVVLLLILAQGGPNQGVPVRLEPASNSSPEVSGVAEIADQDVTQIEQDLEDIDTYVRLAAISRLNKLAQGDHERFGPILAEALSNDNSRVKFLAANGLANIKYAPAAKALTVLLDDSVQDVRTQAGQALIKLELAGLRAVMEGLAENRIGRTDEALVVVTAITGRTFGKGQEGRAAALEFWVQYSRAMGGQ